MSGPYTIPNLLTAIRIAFIPAIIQLGVGAIVSGVGQHVDLFKHEDYFTYVRIILVLFCATVAPELGPHGISAFLVPRDAPGLTVGRNEDKLCLRASSSCRRHSGRSAAVSSSDNPSVNQRGTRERESCSANTCCRAPRPARGSEACA